MAGWKEAIRRRLETQATLIEDLLAREGMMAVVTGGMVYGREVEFYVRGPVARLARTAAFLEQALSAVLDCSGVAVVCSEDEMVVRVMAGAAEVADWVAGEAVLDGQVEHPPLSLLDLMASVRDRRPLTMILGVSEEERPLLLHLPTADVSNMLVVGDSGCGKSTLLQAILFSMAARNKRDFFQAAVIDYDPAGEAGKGALAAFSHLPHLLEPAAVTLEQAIRVLDRLLDTVRYRQEEDIEAPMILLVVDDLDGLLEAGQRPITNRLIRLLEYGAEVGIHVVLALEKTSGEFADKILKCDLPVRFIGRVGNEKLARAAAGILETGAERLAGSGDFIAVNGRRTFRFQTACISDYGLYLAVEKLGREERRMARPVIFRPGLVRMGP